MEPAELTGLQSFHKGSLCMRCKVISGAKISICLGLPDDIFFFLFRPDPCKINF